jgi:hypothetical protein
MRSEREFSAHNVVSDDADVEDNLLLAFWMLRSSGTTVVRNHAAVVLGGSDSVATSLVGKLAEHVVPHCNRALQQISRRADMCGTTCSRAVTTCCSSC